MAHVIPCCTVYADSIESRHGTLCSLLHRHCFCSCLVNDSVAQDAGLRMIAEATVCGTVFAVLWRISHKREEAKVNEYYKKMRAQQE